MKRLLILLICVLLALPATLAEGGTFQYRYADASEAAELLLSNRHYYDNLNQADLNFRMQKLDATLEALEALVAGETRDYTDAEKDAVDSAMAAVEETCAARGYALPVTDGIVFAKTTMREECEAGAYTHGTQIYLGEHLLALGLSENPETLAYFREVVAHELFHCLTRNHPDFRRDMYGILGFKVVDEDFDFAPAIREVIISNPDVGHHNSYAAFEINGEMKNCAVIFTTGRPFEQPGDNFFDSMVTGLVPIDDLATMYTSEEAANFWEVFGRNTSYVIDPEETLADNFAYTLVYPPEDKDYPSPEIIRAIDAYLKANAGEEAA